jgi:hypothetical protein
VEHARKRLAFPTESGIFVGVMIQSPPAKDLIRYDLLVQDALKGVVRKVLVDAGREGLPGDHHFYISFRTDVPGVRLSQRMREKYPEEMTIVLQHQFWDLGITEHTFEVGLSFNGIPERLLIPFDALVGFFDPSVQFGLKFELNGEGQAATAGTEASAAQETGRDKPRLAGPRLAVAPADGEADHEAGAGQPDPSAPDALPRPSPKAQPKARAAKVDVPPPSAAAAASEEAPVDDGDDKQSAQVVSLDAFRKKP